MTSAGPLPYETVTARQHGQLAHSRQRAHAITRPSRISTTRSAAPATREEWVTITTVLPWRSRSCAQRVEHALLVAGVELAGRLVSQHQRRPPGVRGGDRDPLLLPARQRADTVPSPRPQTEHAQSVLSRARGIVVPGQAQRDRHVLPCRQRRPQVLALEHQRDLPCPVAGQPLLIEPPERALTGAHLPGRGLIERRRQRQHRALATPRGAEHRDQLASLHPQLQAPQRDRLNRAGADRS